MNKVQSKDGTLIAYDRVGEGPPVILVDGALCYRASGPCGPIAAQLAPHFTVFTYDRRGRGDSGDTSPYATEREVEDIDALIQEAGGSAHVFGISSGALLAVEAANHGLAVKKVAVYEAPVVTDDSREPIPADIVDQFRRLVAEDKRGDAVALFMRQVGVPGFFVTLMRLLPAWSKMKAVAHTLPYDFTLMEGTQAGKPLPAGRWASAKAPTLVIAGGKSPAWMRNGQAALADALPNAEHRVLAGQTHMVKAQVLAPMLIDYFKAPEAAASETERRPAGGEA